LSDRRLPEPHLRDEFRRELRARLMREAALMLVPRRETAWTSRFRPAFAIGLASLALMLGAGVAAANSVPGDFTFGMKRAVEEVRVALTFDEVDRVRVLANMTDERLGELERVADSDDQAPAASEAYVEAITRFRSAVDVLQQTAPQAQSDEAQVVVDESRDKHEIVLENLKSRVPEKAKQNVERAIEQERKDTQNTKGKKGDQDKGGQNNQGQTSSPRGAATARPAATPRPTERAATQRPSQTPRRNDDERD
jgi:colicin import membrane protein